MSLYTVIAEGCDEATLVVIDLSRAESRFVSRLADLITETSTYNCMPTLSIRAATDADVDCFNEKD